MKSKKLALMAAGLLGVPVAANAFTYAEPPDLAGDQASPTLIGAMSAGLNTVSGFDSIATDVGGQGDAFALTLSSGQTLSSVQLVVSNYTGTAQFAATVFGPGYTNVSQQALSANGTYAFSGLSFTAPTTIAFSTQFINATSSGFNWLWNIVVDGRTVVPEPGTFALLGLGLAGLGLSRRRKAN